MEGWPEVVACYAMTGEMDYLLRVHVEDMEHFSRFMMKTLLIHPSVADVKSSFALQRIKDTTALAAGVRQGDWHERSEDACPNFRFEANN